MVASRMICAVIYDEWCFATQGIVAISVDSPILVQ